jgi:hypothetical protein
MCTYQNIIVYISTICTFSSGFWTPFGQSRTRQCCCGHIVYFVWNEAILPLKSFSRDNFYAFGIRVWHDVITSLRWILCRNSIFGHALQFNTHVKISQLVNKPRQQACIASLSTSCNNVVILSSCYTRLSFTTCWQIDELQDDNKLLEQLVTSLLSSTNL